MVHAASAEEALDHPSVAAVAPDLAVVDILLPGRDGRDVVRSLRERPATAACRVAVSSVVDPDDLGVEVDAVLAKPFRRQDVVRALHRAGVVERGVVERGGGVA